jgi:hypothetical protein
VVQPERASVERRHFFQADTGLIFHH